MAVSKSRWQVIVLCGAAWVVACGSAPELPRVSAPQPTLDADDHAVMRATLDYLRPERDDSIRRGSLPRKPPQIDARFLVIEVTATACVGNRDPAQSGLPGCVGDHWLKAFPRVAANVGPSLEMFRRRNARPFPISGDLGADVVLVSATSGSVADLDLLRRSHPHGSEIVCFSAPVYLGGAAVIFYRILWEGGGFARLERNGSEWKVVDRRGWIE